MHKKISLTLLLIVSLCMAVPSASRADEYTAFDFLRLEMNARAAALGNAFVSMRGDPTIMFHNPGGLSTVPNGSLSIGFIKHLLDVNAGYAAYVHEMEGIGWVSGGVTYLNYGSFKRTDGSGNELGEFGAGDVAVSVGYGNFYENIHYGGSVKFIYSSIESASASALAIDAGVTYVIPTEEIAISMSILNSGAELSPYGNIRESLPFEVRVGISKKLEHLPLLLNLNFHKLTEQEDNFGQHFAQFSIGGEFTLSEYVQARIGYNNERRKEMKTGTSAGLAGFSAGLGIKISDYKFDYAFSSFGKIFDMHRFSLSTVIN